MRAYLHKTEKYMDAKITKTRLSRMLSYDWLKIVVGAVAAIIVWSLIFTMTATRITSAQQFSVMNYVGNASFTTTKFNELYNQAFSENVFSYEVIEINQQDLAANGEYANTVMEARMATEEGDIIFVADVDNPDTAVGEGENVTYEYTYLETLLMRNRAYLYELDPEKEGSFFYKMEAYLNEFYGGDWKNGTLNEEKVETQFRTRVKKDKRFKKEKQIAQGVQDDIARIKKYRDALDQFYGWIEDGTLTFTTTVFSDREVEENVYYPADGIYSVNICPDKKMSGLDKYVGYYIEVIDEETGKTHNKITAENMNVAFFDFPGVEEGFQYESLLMVNYLVGNVLNQNQAQADK